MINQHTPTDQHPVGTARVPGRRAGFRPREYMHIVFRTRQPDALVDWYCKVLGMQVVMRHPLIVFLTWDDSQDRLAIVCAPDAPPACSGCVGFHHAAFNAGSLRELTRHYCALREQGIEPMYCMNHGVATSMYYRDPDGNQIELTVDAFRCVEALNAWLSTGAFDVNPVGVPCDPEELCRRLDAGEPEEELLRPDSRHRERLQDALAVMQS